mmetsp:Transcript_11330/g.26218  ORF Transcript_11330/g.26218 Transcript_11330/m.26218 type:complete len:231 (+) Transcript_11330:126-818(+)
MEALPSDRAEYQGKLLNATARQKNVENDAQLLQNRIALLKKEEARAWRKIQQTKGRAEEIVRMRKENERKNQEKVVMAKRAEEKERKLAEENLRMEERARRARAMQLDEMYRKKQQEVAVVKMEKVNNKEYVQKQNMMSLKEKKAKREAIKRHEEEIAAQRKAEKAAFEQANEEAYLRRVKTKHTETRRKEKQVTNLEKVEMKLIQKLRNTQQLQQQAFHELESALNGDV